MKRLEKIAFMTAAGLCAGHLIQQWLQNRDVRWCRMAAGESRYERAQARPWRKHKSTGKPAPMPRSAEWVQSTV